MADEPNFFDQLDPKETAAAAAGKYDNYFFDLDPPGQPRQAPELFSKLGESGDALAAQPSGFSAILHAFGQGVANGWGTESLGLDDETVDWMRSHGVFNDYQKGHATFWKTANEAFIRDAALGLDLAFRRIPMALYGGVRGVAEVPEPAGMLPRVAAAAARAATAGMEASPEGGLFRNLRLPPSLSFLNAARAARIIGPEAGETAIGAAEAPHAAPVPPSEEAEAIPPPLAAPTPEAVSREAAPAEASETYNIGGTRVQANTLLLAYSRQIEAGVPEAEAAKTAVTEAAAEAAAAPPPPPIVPGGIASDISRQLVAAGRPQEEADLAGALVDARYRARAAWFKGALGTAEDLYSAQAPRILGPRRQRTPVAGPAAAPAAVPEGPLITGARPEGAPPEGLSMPPALVAEVERRMAPADEQAGQPVPIPERPATAPSPAPIAAPRVGEVVQNPGGGFDIHGGPGAVAWASTREAADQIATEFGQRWAARQAGAPETLEQARRGRITLPAEGEARATIRLMGNSDASTFIHEFGHDSLEQLMRDAAHPAAPPELVADARAAREWIGAEEGQPIGRFAHEKFAGGFERYLMEGKAPTPALARVFERFKQWLLNVYNAVSGLRPPTKINDAIRGVFDRMLSGPEGEGAPLVREAEAPPETPSEPLTEAPVDKPEPVPTQVPGTATGSPPESRLIDKAGNIRLDNIDAPEDIKQALRDSADRNDDFLTRRRGVVSDEQRERLATLLGTTPNKVLTKGIGEAFTDSEIKFLERTLAQSANDLKLKAAKAVETGAPADQLSATEALLRHDMIQGLFSQATAEAGRALRAFHRSQEVWSKEMAAEVGSKAKAAQQAMQDATGRSLNQMDAVFRKIASLDQAGQLTRAARDAMKPGLLDWAQATWVNWLISGPLTHATYTVAGHILGMFRAGAEVPLSWLAGMARGQGIFWWLPENARNAAQNVRLREARAAFYGQAYGSAEGIRAAWSAWKSGTTELPAEVTKVLGGTSGQPVSGRVGIIPGQQMYRGVIPIGIGSTIETPGRMVAALHSFNWTAFYRSSIHSQAYRAAVREGFVEGSDPFAQRVAELTLDPTEEMIREGATDASSGALITKPSYDSAMGALSRLMNYGYKLPDLGPVPMGTFRPGKWIDPFIQIQANIQQMAFGRGTPLALFSRTVRDDLAGRNGAEAFDQRAGRLLAGTLFMGTAVGLWAAGILNDSGPSDPAEAAAYRRRNGMPHGLQIGNLSFNIMRLGPLGLQMAVAADLAKMGHHIAEGDAAQVGADLVMAFADNIVDESFMRGPQELLQAIDDPDRYGARWMRGFISSLAVPYSVGMAQVTHEFFDPELRRARTILDAIKAKIPGLSYQVPPLYDVWGRPISSEGWALTYYEHNAHTDPVELELDRLGIYPKMPLTRIGGVLLTDAQYAEYSRVAGTMAKARLDGLIPSGVYQMAPDVAKASMIKGAIDVSRAMARTGIQMGAAGTDHDLVSIGLAAKAAIMRGATPKQAREIRSHQ